MGPIDDKRGFASWLNTAANIAILVAAFAFVTNVVRNQWFPSKVARPRPLTTGSQLRIPDLYLDSKQIGVILALHPNCVYCRKSAPFYRRLVERTRGINTVRVHAVFPNDVGGGEYLKSLGLEALSHSTVDFPQNGFIMTPTLVLMSSDGKVKSVWRGQLDPNQEADAMSRIAFYLNQARSAVTPEEALALVRAGRAVLLDVRQREAYNGNHVAGALNIPADELEARALNELDGSMNILLYCDTDRESLARYGHEILSTLKFESVAVVRGGLQAFAYRASTGSSPPQ